MGIGMGHVWNGITYIHIIPARKFFDIFQKPPFPVMTGQVTLDLFYLEYTYLVLLVSVFNPIARGDTEWHKEISRQEQ